MPSVGAATNATEVFAILAAAASQDRSAGGDGDGEVEAETLSLAGPATDPSIPLGASASPIAIGAGPAVASTTPSATPVPLDQVGITVAQAAKAGTGRIDITLSPEDLGDVRVSLQFDGAGGATAHFTAERQDTLNLLQQDQGNLVQALKDAGFDSASTSLTFDLSGGQLGSGTQDFAQNQPDTQAGAGWAALSAYGGRSAQTGDAGATLAAADAGANQPGNLRLYDLSI